MRCNNCGWKNQDGAKVCEKCSEPLIPISVPAEQNAIVASVANEPSSLNVEINNCPKCGYPVKLEDADCPNCGAVVNRHSSKSASDMDKRKTRIMAKESVESAVTSHFEETEIKYPPQPKFGKDTVREEIFTRDITIEKFEKTKEKSGKLTVREIPEEMMDVQGKSQTTKTTPINNSTDNSFESVPAKELDSKSESAPIKSPSGFKLIPADFTCGSDAMEFSGDKVLLKRSNVSPNNIVISEDPAHSEIAFEDGSWYIRDQSGRNATFVVAKKRIRIEFGDEIIIGNKKFIFSE